MLKHFVTFSDSGPVVAYTRHDGTASVVCECATEQQAINEAARLNFESAARAAAHRDGQARPSRRARYFPDDQWA